MQSCDYRVNIQWHTLKKSIAFGFQTMAAYKTESRCLFASSRNVLAFAVI